MAPSLTTSHQPTQPTQPTPPLKRHPSPPNDPSASPSFYPGGLPPAPRASLIRGSSRGPNIDMVRTKQRHARPNRPRSVSQEAAEQQDRMDLDERAVSGGEERALDDDDDDDGSDLSSAQGNGTDQDEEQDELIEEEVGDGADDTVGPQVMRSKKSGAAGAPAKRGPRGTGAARHGETDDGDSPAELGPEDRSKAAAYAEKMRAAAAMGATPSPARKPAALPLAASSSQPPRVETQRANSSASQSSTPAQAPPAANGAHQRSNSAVEDRKPRVSEVPAKAGTPGGVTPPPKDDPRLENALLAPKPAGQKNFPPPTEGGNLLPQEVDKFLQLIEKHNLDASDDAGMARSVTLLYQEWLEWCARAGTRVTKSKKALVGEFVRIHQGAYGTQRQKRAMAIVEGHGSRAAQGAPKPSSAWTGPPTRGGPPLPAGPPPASGSHPVPIAPGSTARHPGAGPPVQLQNMPPSRNAMGPPPTGSQGAPPSMDRKRMMRPSPIVVVGSNMEQVYTMEQQQQQQGPPPQQHRPRPPPPGVTMRPPPEAPGLRQGPSGQHQGLPPPSQQQGAPLHAPPPPQRGGQRLVAPSGPPAVSSPRAPINASEVAAAAANAGFDPHSPRPRSARQLPAGLFDMMKADIRNDVLAEVDQANSETTAAMRELTEANRSLKTRVEQLEQHADNLALWIHHITAQLGMSTGAAGGPAGEGSRPGSPHSAELAAHHARRTSGPESEDPYVYGREQQRKPVSGAVPQPRSGAVLGSSSAPRYRQAPPHDDEYDQPPPVRRDDGYGPPPPRGHPSHQMVTAGPPQGGPPKQQQQQPPQVMRSRHSYGHGHGPGSSNGQPPQPQHHAHSGSYQREAPLARGGGDAYGGPLPGAGGSSGSSSGKMSYASAAGPSSSYDHAPQRMRQPPMGYAEDERGAKRPRHIG